MKSATPSRSLRVAFTLMELFIVVAIVAIGVALLLPALARPKHRPGLKCINNLKNVGLAFRIYASDNDDLFPWQTKSASATNDPSEDLPLRYFLAVSNELSTPKLLICPMDTRQFATSWANLSRTNISFFLSPDADETYPTSIMAGDRNITTNGVELSPGRVRLPHTTSPALSWNSTQHESQGNVCMADGSIQQLSPVRLREQFRIASKNITNQFTTILVP